MSVDVEKLRASLKEALDTIGGFSRDIFGQDVPDLPVHTHDQCLAGFKDVLRGMGLNPDDPDHIHAAIAGGLLLASWWERQGSSFSMLELYLSAHLWQMLEEMVT